MRIRSVKDLQDHKLRLQRFDRLERLSNCNEHWAGALRIEMCRDSEKPVRRRNAAYEIGFLLLGPIFSNFIHWVIERVKQENIDSVLFPARDGFVLAEIYEMLCPAMFHTAHVPHHYVFLTRQVVYPASVDQIGEPELMMGLRVQRPTVRAFLIRLGLAPETFEDIARECGLNSLDVSIGKPYSLKVENHGLLKLVKHPKLLSALRSNKKEKEALLYEYLGQFGFWGCSKVALVDLAWWGTVQESITRTFAHRHDRPSLHGFYLALLKDHPATAYSVYECLLYQKGKNSMGYALAKNFAAILEMASRAPHATTTELRRTPETGNIVPVFRDESQLARRKELDDRELISDLQRGIFDFARAYADLISFQQDPPECYTPFFLSQLDRFAHMPEIGEARIFGGSFHVDDFGSDYSLECHHAGSKNGSLRSFLRSFSNYRVNWMQGALASLGLPCLVTGWNIWRIARRGWS